MITKVIYFVFFVAFNGFFVVAQDDSTGGKIYKFRNNLSYYTQSVDDEAVEPHYLGDIIAKKMYLLKETYTSIQPATPTSPSEKTIVEKPIIYYAVNKLNRKYKKEIQKDIITEEEARENMSMVIDVSLSILPENTAEFEKELRSAKKTHEIVDIFSRVVLE
ncbi:MAG: hypothetical protein ACOC0C_06975 [Bacteroidota bacterium]